MKPVVNKHKGLALPAIGLKETSGYVGRFTGCSMASPIFCTTPITSVISDEDMGERPDSSPITFGNWALSICECSRIADGIW